MQFVRTFIKIEKDYAIEILTSLVEKNFSLTSLDLQGFENCDINVPGLLDFFENHCSNLKLLALDGCCDKNDNLNSGPFFKMLSRIDFNFLGKPPL